MKLSIVTPIFNEEENLPELYRRLTAAAQQVSPDYELIFVNDGSRDRSLEIIRSFALLDPHLRFLSFSRNFGHQPAISAGIKYAKGEAIVIIDGDLQDPPELIPALYARYQEGYKVVYAKRASRKGESFFKKITASVFYRFIKRITNVDIPVDTGDFRLISKEIAQVLNNMAESSKFIRGQIAWMGFKQTFVEFDRDERKYGATKFTLRKMLRFAMDGITSFSNFPLQIATFLGFLFSMVAFLIILYALYAKFVLQEVVTGWTSLIISTMFIGGVQLLCIGVIGEYISRIANDVKKRPLFIVEESNLED